MRRLKGVRTIELSSQAIYANLHSASPKRVSVGAMKILNAIQDDPPDIQLAAASVIFLTLCCRFRLEPSVALNCVDNVIRAARRYDKGTFKGVSDYFKNEV